MSGDRPQSDAIPVTLSRASRSLVVLAPTVAVITGVLVLVALSLSGLWQPMPWEPVAAGLLLGALALLLPDVPVLAGGRLFPFPTVSVVLVLMIALFGPLPALAAGVPIVALSGARRALLTDSATMLFRGPRLLLDASLTWLVFLLAVGGAIVWTVTWGALAGYVLGVAITVAATFAVERDIGYRFPRDVVSAVEMVTLPVLVAGAGVGVVVQTRLQGFGYVDALAAYVTVAALLVVYSTWSRDRWTRLVDEAALRLSNWMKHRHVGLADADPGAVGYVEAATVLEFVSLLQTVPGVTGCIVAVSPEFDARSPIAGNVYTHSGRGGMTAVVPQPMSPTVNSQIAAVEESPRSLSFPLALSDVNVGTAIVTLAVRYRTAERSPALEAMVNTFALGLTSLKQARDLLVGARWGQVEERYDARTGTLSTSALLAAGDDLLTRLRDDGGWAGVAVVVFPDLSDMEAAGISADHVVRSVAERARDAVPHLRAVAGNQQEHMTIVWSGFSAEHVAAPVPFLKDPLLIRLTGDHTDTEITVGVHVGVVLASPEDAATITDLRTHAMQDARAELVGEPEDDTVTSSVTLTSRDGLHEAFAEALTGAGGGLSLDSGPVRSVPDGLDRGRWLSLRWLSPTGDVALHGDALFSLADRVGMWDRACAWLAALAANEAAHDPRDLYVLVPSPLTEDTLVDAAAGLWHRLPTRCAVTVSPLNLIAAEALLVALTEDGRRAGVFGVGGREDSIPLVSALPVDHAVLDPALMSLDDLNAVARLLGSQVRYAELRGYPLLDFARDVRSPHTHGAESA